MFSFLRPSRPAPKTDLQSRLRYIETECKRIKTEASGEENKHIADLAYCVSYLAAIVEKHMREGEN